MLDRSIPRCFSLIRYMTECMNTTSYLQIFEIISSQASIRAQYIAECSLSFDATFEDSPTPDPKQLILFPSSMIIDPLSQASEPLTQPVTNPMVSSQIRPNSIEPQSLLGQQQWPDHTRFLINFFLIHGLVSSS